MHAQLQQAEAGPRSQVQFVVDITWLFECLEISSTTLHSYILSSLLPLQEADACQKLDPPETSASAAHLEDDDAVLPVRTQRI